MCDDVFVSDFDLASYSEPEDDYVNVVDSAFEPDYDLFDDKRGLSKRFLKDRGVKKNG